VFLSIGQSNEAGYGTPYDAALDTTDPLILQLGQRVPNVGQFYLASEPLDHSQVACSTCIGHALSFARSYIALHPYVRVILVPAAAQGTGFSDRHWHVGDDLYTIAVSQANLAMSLSPNNTKFVAFIWDQGESDTGHGGGGFPMGREAYFDSMFQLIRGLRTSITGVTVDTPFITFEFVPGWFDNSAYPADLGRIAQAQGDVLNNIFRVAQPSSRSPTVLGGDGTTGDVHYSAASQRELGKRCNQTLHTVLTQQPTLPSSLQSVSSFNITVYNTFVELEWNRVPYATGYIISELSNSSIQLNITYINYKLHAIIPSLTPATTNYTFIILATYTDSKNNTVFSSTATNVSSAGLPIVSGNPVADWKLDFSTGTILNVGSNPYITPSAVNGGGITYPSDSTRKHTVAQLASSAYWDLGTNSTVPLSYTKTFWINQASNSDGNIISMSVHTASAQHITMISSKRVISYHSGGNLLTLKSPVDVTLNTWAFYAITFDSTTRLKRMYINGIFASQRYIDIPPTTGTFDPCTVGSYNLQNSYTFIGKMDYPSVYPTALSPGQVYAVYASEL
jgi:hypothetical protein